MHSGVVCNENDKTAVDSGIGKGEERVGGNVKTNVLHSASGSVTCERSAECDLKCNLLIGRPFAIYLRVFSGKFCDLGGRSTGIGGNELASGFVKTARKRLVSEH